jgi:hypothetical protein
MGRILKISLYISLVGVLLLLLFVLFLRSDLNPSFRTSEIKAAIAQVKATKALPENFVSVYKQADPITDIPGLIVDRLFKDRSRSCPCLEAASIMRPLYLGNSRITGSVYVLAWKLEKELSQRQCLNYLVSNFDFLYQNIGIEKASHFYFSNNLADLNSDQMKILVLMLENPLVYNPKRNARISERVLVETVWTHTDRPDRTNDTLFLKITQKPLLKTYQYYVPEKVNAEPILTFSLNYPQSDMLIIDHQDTLFKSDHTARIVFSDSLSILRFNYPDPVPGGSGAYLFSLKHGLLATGRHEGSKRLLRSWGNEKPKNNSLLELYKRNRAKQGE